MMQNNEIVPVVHVKDGQVFANSKDVADFFGKRHCHVIDSVEEINRNLGRSEQGTWFRIADYRDSYGRWQKAYDMTRDGFTLLVMGYTGKKASVQAVPLNTPSCTRRRSPPRPFRFRGLGLRLEHPPGYRHSASGP